MVGFAQKQQHPSYIEQIVMSCNSYKSGSALKGNQ